MSRGRLTPECLQVLQKMADRLRADPMNREVSMGSQFHDRVHITTQSTQQYARLLLFLIHYPSPRVLISRRQ